MTNAKPTRFALAATLSIMFLALGWRLILFLSVSAQALNWPYELDYGEGIVWQQANLMFTPAAYGSIDGFPSIVFHYPPLYHVVTRAVAALSGVNMLIAGRLVSIVSTLLIGLFAGLIAKQTVPEQAAPAARTIAALTAGLAVFTLYPVDFWGVLMRVDMLAIALSLCGFWLGLRAFDRPKFIYAAALCFVAAVYAKQTCLAAPAALFGLMLWLRPALAVRGIVACIIIGLAALGALDWVTDGGFHRHIIFYNLNRIEWSRLWRLAILIRIDAELLIIAAVLTLFFTVEQWRRSASHRSLRALASQPAHRNYAAVLAYAFTTAMTLPTIAKSGSNLNYAIEWMVVTAIVVGAGLGLVLSRKAAQKSQDGSQTQDVIRLLLIPAAVALQAMVSPSFDLLQATQPARRAALNALSARIRAADKPIISDEMVILLQSGKRVVWEPAIFAELVSKGIWDERPFVQRIHNHEFAMFITVNTNENKMMPERYSPAVMTAVEREYPVLRHYAEYTARLPRP